LRGELGEAAFTEAWEAGRKLTADAAVAFALAELGADVCRAAQGRAGEQDDWLGDLPAVHDRRPSTAPRRLRHGRQMLRTTPPSQFHPHTEGQGCARVGNERRRFRRLLQ